MIIYEVWLHHNGEHIKLWENEDYWLVRKYIHGYPKKPGERLTKRRVYYSENHR